MRWRNKAGGDAAKVQRRKTSRHRKSAKAARRGSASADLRRTATYLAEAEKLSHTGCWARNTRTGELFWSEEEWRIFGLDPATTKISYEVFLSLVHPDDRSSLDEASKRAVHEKKTYDIPFRAVLRDGTIKHLHSVGRPVFKELGEVVEYIGVTTDETERIRATAAVYEAQAELARIARLTTMGELTASIAHEINQPLAAVIASGTAALRWLDRPIPDLEEATEALKNIISEGNRASEVIERIRAFLKHRTPRIRQVRYQRVHPGGTWIDFRACCAAVTLRFKPICPRSFRTYSVIASSCSR